MATGDLIKLGTLYVGGVRQPNPVRPWPLNEIPEGAVGAGDIPNYTNSSTVEIRNSDSLDPYKIKWREVNDAGKKLLISDRNILSSISYSQLLSLGLVNGKEITIDNQKYMLRLISGGENYRLNTEWKAGGKLDNEWDNYIVNENSLPNLPIPTFTDLDGAYGSDFTGEHNTMWHWARMRSWTKEPFIANPRYSVLRSGTSARGYFVEIADTIAYAMGYRPVLEVLNASPNITDNTNNNKVFYEQEILNINGSVSDTDNGDIMSVKYKVNNGTTRAIATSISDGTTPIAYSKTIKFTNNKLYDGVNEVATGLVDGQTYAITIWAEDDKGGKSTEIVRNFTVVPNRPPVLAIDPITPKTDKINSELLSLSGTVTDADGNDVAVSLRLNESTSKQIYSGVPSAFTTDIKISDLIEGSNTLTITAKDTFDFVITKTVTIKKTKNATKLKTGVARYKVNPPSGSAKQIIAWIQKEVGDLIVDADVSMVDADAQEVYVPMTKLSAPIDDLIEEDEFSHEELVEKSDIVLKLKLTKIDALSTASIKQVSGVLK